MIKELQYKGYATEPSDYECPDGQLATSLNLLNEDNQLKPLFQPATRFSLPTGMTVISLHNVSHNKRNYIIRQQNKLYYAKTDDIENEQQLITLIYDFNTHTINDITPFGNTLVILADDGMHYILWNSDDEDYSYLGQKIPSLQLQFGLNVEMTCWPKDNMAGNHAERALTQGFISGEDMLLPFWNNGWAEVEPKDNGPGPESWEGAFNYSLQEAENLPVISNTISRWTNFALGQVNKFVAEQHRQQRFSMPFFVRWAYEINDGSDGSHVMHSDPILLIPSSKYPVFAMDMGSRGFRFKDVDNDNRRYWFGGRTYGFAATLMASIIDDGTFTDTMDELLKWKDIVKGISIFVSAPIYTYNQDGKVYGWTNMDDTGAWDEFFTEGKTALTGHSDYGQHAFADIFQLFNEASAQERSDRYYVAYDANHPLPDYILTMPEKNTEDIRKNVETVNFYKVASYDINDMELFRMAVAEQPVKIDDGVLESLNVRQTMKDDYHSHDTIHANKAYMYNGRLNLSGVSRLIHNPMPPSLAWPKDDHMQKSWNLAVKIKSNGKTSIVAASGDNGCVMPRFIFYPNRNADTAWVAYEEGGGQSATTHKWQLPLTEHPLLEGAYWFGGLEKEINEQQMDGSDDIPEPDGNPLIDEPNKIYTSEVNNPFYFPLLGINNVGTGSILGISSAAKAMSQGQFGQYPLYAFTTEGVWALEISSSGSYSARQPITRDVCINPDSITQLDSAVLFATDRGIMLLSGSSAQCITDGIFSEAPFNVLDLPGVDQLHTKLGHSADACLPIQPFLAFLAGCQMVYDYVHQRIFVYNPTKEDGTPKYTYAYVFSLKSKMWGMVFTNLASTINAYPEALAMTHAGKLVSFSETDETVCKGLYITRPLKLEAADVHKTISALIQRGHFQRGDVGTVLYGSRDLYTWHLIWSSKDQYLRGFRGTPYKYFRIAGLATLTDGKSIFGASVNFEPRHTNQLR